MFHGLCDGLGLNRFIEATLYHYFCEKDGKEYSDEGIITSKIPYDESENYDAFAIKTNADTKELKKLGFFDEDGFLHLSGRIKDVIIRGGENIVPVTSLINDLASSVGYSAKRAMSIRLAVEEMLTERIMDAYSASGDIRVQVVLMPEWLRVAFSDDGTEYYIDKRRDTSMSAKIILKAVSDFHTDYVEGKPLYCMDFLY